ncbi:hypothetical protein NBRGN_057_01370 [Nocardia brasiliensis NBRC 14402]|nr:hypothetical protein NBRGN_057_01370 [Nocardia brasiliensis NBRC 14402]
MQREAADCVKASRACNFSININPTPELCCHSSKEALGSLSQRCEHGNGFVAHGFSDDVAKGLLVKSQSDGNLLMGAVRAGGYQLRMRTALRGARRTAHPQVGAYAVAWARGSSAR